MNTTSMELHSTRCNLRFYALTETAEGKEDSNLDNRGAEPTKEASQITDMPAIQVTQGGHYLISRQDFG